MQQHTVLVERSRAIQVSLLTKTPIEHIRRVKPERINVEKPRQRYLQLFQYHHTISLYNKYRAYSEEEVEVETELPTLNRRVLTRYSLLFERERYISESFRNVLIRSKPAFKPIIDLIHAYLVRLYSYDYVLASLPDTVRESIIMRLIEIQRGNPLLAGEIEQQPLLRFYAKRYIAYYMLYPETHNAYALRLTPYTLPRMEGKALQYYALRVFSAQALKLSSISGYARRVAFRLMRYITKAFYELVNAMCYVGSTGSSRYDKIATTLDDMQNPMFKRRVLELVYRPHEIKRWCAKSLGFPELDSEITHYSILAIERKSRVGKLYDYNAYKRLVMDLKRRRVSESLSLNAI
jgi:hypothetical protein